MTDGTYASKNTTKMVGKFLVRLDTGRYICKQLDKKQLFLK